MEIVLLFLSLLSYSEKEYNFCKDQNIETICVIEESEMKLLDDIKNME
jgi:hypothetical protein